MIDENIKSNSTYFFPYLSAKSNDLMLSRENSFFDTKFTSKEFQLEYNKSFNNQNPMYDTKFTQMLTRTNNINVLMRTEKLICSLDNERIQNNDCYKKLSECLFDILSITSNPSNEKEEYLKALQYQQKLINIMIMFIDSKLNE